MQLRFLLPGALLALLGVALSATFSLGGPTIPRSPLGVVGWALLLVGLVAMKVGAELAD